MDLNQGITTTESKDQGIRYRLDLEYDGTDFSGWQLQPETRTVQGCLEAAVERLFGEHATVIAAGRTDAGVHATGQVAHFTVTRERSPDVIVQALNALLPPDVRVRRAMITESDFHARFSALWRKYCYRIAVGPVAIGRSYVWTSPFRLDFKAMRQAERYIIGEYVFRAFAHENPEERHYLSSVYRAEWIESGAIGEFQIDANRFLHGMVRLLVGTFVDIGRGKKQPDDMAEILASQDVRKSGPKAPASGLTLTGVGYEPWTSSSGTDAIVRI